MNGFNGHLNPPDRLPPSNLEAEQQVLGAILANTIAYPDAVVSGLAGDVFADPIHALIFRALGHGPQDHRALHAVTMRFNQTGELDEVGGPAYLSQIVSLVPANFDAARTMAAVRGAWVRRNLIDVGQNLAVLAEEATEDALEGGQPVPAAAQAANVLHQLKLLVREVEALVAPGGAA